MKASRGDDRSRSPQHRRHQRRCPMAHGGRGIARGVASVTGIWHTQPHVRGVPPILILWAADESASRESRGVAGTVSTVPRAPGSQSSLRAIAIENRCVGHRAADDARCVRETGSVSWLDRRRIAGVAEADSEEQPRRRAARSRAGQARRVAGAAARPADRRIVLPRARLIGRGAIVPEPARRPAGERAATGGGGRPPARRPARSGRAAPSGRAEPDAAHGAIQTLRIGRRRLVASRSKVISRTDAGES